MTTKVTDKNISTIANKFVQWQSVITADGSTATSAVAGQGYLIDTTSATHTINLPSSASNGDSIVIKDYAGTFNTNNLTIGRNGHNIQGAANDSRISSNRANVTLVYIDSTKGWVYTKESNVADLGKPLFITATGGTVATSGDYKIHTFTGDGCFVVSSVGNPLGSDSVDYLVVAGGGAGAGGPGNYTGGGGGAGGLRLASSFPISITAYPITLGAGGSGDASGSAVPGSDSIFSTITSAGGGGGVSTAGTGGPGGSGGGGGQAPPFAGGTGNTPPVSPSQGNNGGTARGGGGGAGAAGASGPVPPGGDAAGVGGAGLDVTPTFGPGLPNSGVYAGGGGGSSSGPAGGGQPGGTGGGGTGATYPGVTTGTAGTSNTGGGGGANAQYDGVGRNGGKGIVIIRYKFQ